MPTTAQNRKGWDALMAALGPDAPSQGQAYEQLRRKLVLFFSSKGSATAEASADETLARMGYKLSQGEVLEHHPSSYALGIARFVYLEAVKSEVRERRAATEAGERAPPDELHHARLSALEACMRELVDDDADLVRRYYRVARGQEKIDARKQLATELGLSLNALRLRSMRLRHALAACVEKRIDV